MLLLAAMTRRKLVKAGVLGFSPRYHHPQEHNSEALAYNTAERQLTLHRSVLHRLYPLLPSLLPRQRAQAPLSRPLLRASPSSHLFP